MINLFLDIRGATNTGNNEYEYDFIRIRIMRHEYEYLFANTHVGFFIKCPMSCDVYMAPKSVIFSRNRSNSMDPIHRRQFFTKSAHRDSICSRSKETIFREINSSLPVNAGWNTCCAMVSHARRSIDTSIVSQSRALLFHCPCKSRLQMDNLGINNAF